MHKNSQSSFSTTEEDKLCNKSCDKFIPNFIRPKSFYRFQQNRKVIDLASSDPEDNLQQRIIFDSSRKPIFLPSLIYRRTVVW